MKFTTDNGGFATSCNDIKLFFSNSTWATKLSQLAKTNGKLIIMTRGLSSRSDKYFKENIKDDNSYIRNILGKRPDNVYIICNSEAIDEARIIKQLYPKILIKHHPKVNANIALMEPRTVFFSSSSFGYSNYDDFGIGFHSEDIYNKLKEKFREQWKKGIVV